MEQNFTGPLYTLGVEEELMIVDGESMDLVSAIEEMIEAVPWETEGEVKPELMQSVLEISTNVCRSAGEAAGQLEDLRRRVRETAETKGLTIGSAATHPFAKWEEQRIVDRPRYLEVVDALRFVARQELLFGLHVHVGIDDPEKAIHVANGMRVHVPILLALSSNSPFWRGVPTGLMSTRTPIFKTFPRVGVPPRYESWSDFEARVEFMVTREGGRGLHLLLVGRPPAPQPRHRRDPRLRRADAARAHDGARGPHPGDVQGAGRALRGRLRARDLSARDARGEQVAGGAVRARGRAGRPAAETRASHAIDLARRLVERLRPHARELDCEREFEGIDDLIERGTGARRQLSVWRANRDMRSLLRKIVEATAVGVSGRIAGGEAGAGRNE